MWTRRGDEETRGETSSVSRHPSTTDCPSPLVECSSPPSDTPIPVMPPRLRPSQSPTSVRRKGPRGLGEGDRWGDRSLLPTGTGSDYLGTRDGLP